MVVAVQAGLNTLKHQLILKGFNVVTYGEYQHPIDVLIYSGGINIEQVNQYVNSFVSDGARRGVFLINAHNKTPEEIIQMLLRRSYSAIF